MPQTNVEGMATLIKKAKEDPSFFHSLVWNTEKSLESVDFLSRKEKAAILKIDPEDLVVGLATGDFRGIGTVEECGSSCGSSCGVSCGISCGVSCGTSCAVSELMPDAGAAVSNPVDIGRENLMNSINREISNTRFSRFRRGG